MSLSGCRCIRHMKGEQGFSLIEVLVSLALLGIITVGFIGGLGTALIASAVGQERLVAESLGKSQLEYIKVQGFIPAAGYTPDDPESCYQPIDIPDGLVDKGYDIEINAPQTINTSGGDEFELQNITVVIKCNGEEMLTLSDYKTGRSAQ